MKSMIVLSLVLLATRLVSGAVHAKGGVRRRHEYG